MTKSESTQLQVLFTLILLSVLKAAHFLKPNQRIVKQTGDNDKDPVNLEMLFICSTEFS